MSGEVEMELTYEPRFNYGQVMPRLYDRKHLGFWCTSKGEALTLRSDLPLAVMSDGNRVSGRLTLHRGDRRFAGLSFTQGEPLILPPLGEEAAVLVSHTVRWWQSWAAQCEYAGPFGDAVLRSALVLKLMTYAPSGAIVAAPTTSLPEAIGGSWNWDYRYCWLRDAAMTM
jgi:hypothetical protein